MSATQTSMARAAGADDLLRLALESAPCGMLMTDAQGCIVLVNAATERLLGYARSELLGAGVELLVPERLREAHRAHRAQFATAPVERALGAERDLSVRRKDGSEVAVEIGLTPLETSDGMFYIASISDITARRQADAERTALEERLRHGQKMEAVGRLAGGVAHDFNNILTAIIGFGDLAREVILPGAAGREDLEQMLIAAARGAALTRQMLAFSRQQELQRGSLDLNDLVTGIDAMLRRLLGTDVSLTTRLAPELPRVFADRNQIEQVVLNLAINARDAMPWGGALVIATFAVDLDEHYARVNVDAKSGPHVALAVTDAGTGMDRDTQNRIFEPFFTTKPPGKGTGLGLSTVYGIVRQSEGSISVDSEIGRGTTFTVYLPESADKGVDPHIPTADPALAPLETPEAMAHA